MSQLPTPPTNVMMINPTNPFVVAAPKLHQVQTFLTSATKPVSDVFASPNSIDVRLS
jgi:hypothetical protein